MSVACVETNLGIFWPWHLKALKEGFETARKTNAEEFDFEGQTILTSYAKHLIEYLESMGLEPADKPEDGQPMPINGRPIEELHVLITERVKTITGAMVCPRSGVIVISVDGVTVGTIDWPDLVGDFNDLTTATRQ